MLRLISQSLPYDSTLVDCRCIHVKSQMEQDYMHVSLKAPAPDGILSSMTGGWRVGPEQASVDYPFKAQD